MSIKDCLTTARIAGEIDGGIGTAIGLALVFIPCLASAVTPRFLGGPSATSFGMSLGQQFGETGTWLDGSNDPFSGGAVLAQDSNSGIGFGGSIGALEFSVLLEALESKGMVRTLAEPNLTALSGQEARFLAGGEYPVPVSDNGGIKIEYKPFGVDMVFTPTVVDGDVINVKIAAAVSSIDTTVAAQTTAGPVSGFKTRLTSTTVEMRDGESFAIAGLLQDDFRDINGQVPWLGDVPILGALFRSADYQRSQSELVIIITPHLVTPTRGEALALPTDRVRVPTEGELFLFGKVAGKANTPEGEVARQDFNGAYGYVME